VGHCAEIAGVQQPRLPLWALPLGGDRFDQRRHSVVEASSAAPVTVVVNWQAVVRR